MITIERLENRTLFSALDILADIEQRNRQLISLQASEIPYMLGDVNLDWQVTGDDYTVLDANLGRTGATLTQGDANGDGVVNGDDYTILDSNLGARQYAYRVRAFNDAGFSDWSNIAVATVHSAVGDGLTPAQWEG